MASRVGVLLMLWALPLCMAEITERVVCEPSVAGDIYGFSSRTLNGSEQGDLITFDRYRNQVVLFVNVATYNELTVDTYQMLNKLVTMYAGQPFTILGFPCTQFNREEPQASGTEMYNAFYYVRPGDEFVPNFQLFQRTDVNGAAENEIYTFLKSGCSYTEDVFRTDLEYVELNIYDVRNPFEKFLVDKNGKVQFRYHPRLSTAEDLVPDIDALISA